MPADKKEDDYLLKNEINNDESLNGIEHQKIPVANKNEMSRTNSINEDIQFSTYLQEKGIINDMEANSFLAEEMNTTDEMYYNYQETNNVTPKSSNSSEILNSNTDDVDIDNINIYDQDNQMNTSNEEEESEVDSLVDEINKILDPMITKMQFDFRITLELKKSKRKDYYKILGVTKKASEGEIRKAYRKLAFTHHPGKF